MSSQPPASADDRPAHDAPSTAEQIPESASATESSQPPESTEPQADAPDQTSVEPPAAQTASPGQPAEEPTGSEGAAPASNGAASESAATEKPGGRVQLRPSVDPSQARAIPSLNSGQQSADAGGASKAEPEPGETASADPAGESMPAPAPASPPVELPPRISDLDAELEAEIEAAMSGVKLGTSPPRKAAEDEEGVAAPVEAAQLDEEALEPGTRMKGVVQSVHGEDVFIDAGLRSACVIPVRQFGAEPPEVGRTVEFLVSRYDADQGLVVANLPAGREQVGGNWDAVAAGQVVDCVVTKSNKGGLEVSVGGLRGFLPAGQVDLHYVGDLEPFINQKLTVKVLEVNRQRRNIVVSRRALLEEARADAERTAWQRLEVGQKLTGEVKTIKDYGAFIDLGGVDGFLHIGQISWARIDHPSEVLSEGQQVEVQIVTLEPEKKKIGLGMKQLAQSPWSQAANKYATGTATRGKVTRTMDFGAFVELEPGLEGLVHISELDYKRVNRVTDVLQAGQEVDVQVLEVDPQRKRISLSVKALRAKPAAPDETEEEETAEEQAAKKPRGPLKGGIGSGGGQLFGNPDDYR